MKKLSGIILLILVAALFYFDKPLLDQVVSKFYFSYCDTPIGYQVNNVDPKFGLSKDQFSADVEQAAQIWDRAEGKELFKNDQNGSLSVNLVFDERQSLNNQINSLENNLTNEKNNLSPKEQQYQQLLADFNTKSAQFKQEVDYWNSQGGAPPDQYQKLKQQQAMLEQEANDLNSLARDLNLSADQYNAQVGQLNNTINTFNQALVQRPEEGLYDGKSNTITIYFDNSQPELIHTLAHELGHSLGIDHNNNKKSIMYPYSTTSVTLSAEDLSSLDVACQKHNIFELYYARIKPLLDHYFNK